MLVILLSPPVLAVMCADAALGVDLDRWPPYISNLVFELWELQPPVYDSRNNMAHNSSQGSNHQQGSNSRSSSSGGPYVVRVLYNKQPIKLPGASEGKFG